VVVRIRVNRCTRLSVPNQRFSNRLNRHAHRSDEVYPATDSSRYSSRHLRTSALGMRVVRRRTDIAHVVYRHEYHRAIRSWIRAEVVHLFFLRRSAAISPVSQRVDKHRSIGLGRWLLLGGYRLVVETSK